MKKWLITYLFVVCSICLHTGVFANAAKTSRTITAIKSAYTITPGTFIFKKASVALVDQLADNSSHIFFQHQSIRILYFTMPYFKAELNFFLTISCYVPGGAINKKEVEGLLKDRLSHLYPSHYFW